MEKWMVVYLLPLEVWMDILCFPWISRRKFGQIIDKIGNFKFAEHAQFYLHEWGKRTLSDVRFVEECICNYDKWPPVSSNFPQTQLPPNIKHLGNIDIQHFDANTIDFLGKIRPLLLTNLLEINLADIAPNSLEDLRTILSHLAPFVDGIHTLQCSDDTLPIAKQLFGEKLAKLNMLKYWFHFKNKAIDDEAKRQEHVNSIVDWLTNNEKGPRLCEAQFCDDNGIEFLKQISAAIRQTPCAFALNMFVINFDIETVQVAEFHLENGNGEELHGKWIDGGAKECFQIVRHPANCNTGMQEWIKKMENASIGCIYFNYQTVGSIDADQLDVPSVDEEQAEHQKPSTSKDV